MGGGDSITISAKIHTEGLLRVVRVCCIVPRSCSRRLVVGRWFVYEPFFLTKTRSRTTFQGPIDYKLYEAYGGGAGKAVSAVLNNSRATRMAIGIVAGVVVSTISDIPLSCPSLHAKTVVLDLNSACEHTW